jgi:hypothetical protein
VLAATVKGAKASASQSQASEPNLPLIGFMPRLLAFVWHQSTGIGPAFAVRPPQFCA